MKAVFEKAKFIVDGDTAYLCVAVPAKEAKRFIGEMKPKKYDVEIKEHRERRSLDANAYAWVLLDKLAEKLAIPKTEIYRQYVREVGGNSETVCVREKAADKLIDGWGRNGIGWLTERTTSKLDGCVNVILYYGSSTYDSRQMARFIDMIVLDCKENGIETMTPFELDALKERWK